MNKSTYQAKRIISIAEEQSSSNLYMVIDFVLLDTLVNLNNVQYSEAFINNIVENSESYAGIPLKVDYKKLVAKKVDKLTHNQDPKTKKLHNQMIGSFVKFYSQTNDDGILELCGQVRIPKEFEEACEVIQQLYDDGNLNVSYEIIVGEYTKNGKIIYVDVSEENYLFAYSIVSNPAVTSAKAFALVAELIDSNNQTLEGGEPMQRNKENFTVDQMFESSKIHIAELDLNQVRTKLYNKLIEKMENEYWKYDSQELGVDYMILKQYCTADLIKVEYSVSNNEVNIIDIYDVDKTYIKKNKEEDEVTIAELEEKVKNLETVIASKDTLIAEKDTEINTVKETLQTKETELAEVNGKLTTLSETVLANQTEIAELKTVKESYDTLIAEKQAVELAEKKANLKEKFSKLLSAEVLVEMAEAIESLDETKLNAKVVEVAMSKATEVKPASKETMTASRILDNVKIEGADSTSLRSKYSM